MSEDPATQALREAYSVPDDIHLRAEDGLVLAWVDGGEAAARRVADDPEGVPSAGVHGRAELGRIDDPAGALLVRPYRKGGLLRHVRGEAFHGRMRPLDELVVHRALAAADAPVVEALAAVIRRDGARWTGALLVREVGDSCDMQAWLYGAAAPASATTAEILTRAGAAVRQVHAAGVEHADLHPKNLLLAPDGRVLVLDFDRSRRHEPPLGEEACVQNLARFARSIAKHFDKGMPRERWELDPFLWGYAADEAPRWAERVRDALGHLRLRRAWWRLTGASRPDTPPPGGEA